MSIKKLVNKFQYRLVNRQYKLGGRSQPTGRDRKLGPRPHEYEEYGEDMERMIDDITDRFQAKLAGSPSLIFQNAQERHVQNVKRSLVEYINTIDDYIAKSDIAVKLADVVGNWNNMQWYEIKEKLLPLYQYMIKHFSMVANEKELASKIVAAVRAALADSSMR